MPWKLTADGRITAQALERQMNNWEISRSQRHETKKATHRDVADFITLSREVGVDAECIAEKLGERLRWPVFGKNLLEAMAGDDDVRKRIYRSMDERDLRWWEETLRSVLDHDFGVNDYFPRLTQTVLSLVRQSPCVLIGRGCDLILPPDVGLRVRLVAPLDARVARAARELGVTQQAARREVKRVEAKRAEFLRHHFAERASGPARVDLTLNVDRWSAEVAADLILAAHAKREARVAIA